MTRFHYDNLCAGYFFYYYRGIRVIRYILFASRSSIESSSSSFEWLPLLIANAVLLLVVVVVVVAVHLNRIITHHHHHLHRRLRRRPRHMGPVTDEVDEAIDGQQRKKGRKNGKALVIEIHTKLI